MALDRLTPTSGPKTGSAYATEVQEEVTGLWDRSVITLTAVAGTDTITATATPSLTGALGGSMNFILKPAATNTGAVTLNINSSGAVAVVDAEGTALTAGALRINGNYLLHYDSGISKYVVVGYVPAANVPVGLKYIATVSASTCAAFNFFHGATPSNGGSGSVTASGTVVLDNTYDAYKLVISNLVPATDDVELWLRIGTGGTPTYQTTNYSYAFNFVNNSGQSAAAADSAAKIVLGSNTGASEAVGNAATENASCEIIFDNPDDTTLHKIFSFQGGYLAANAGRLNSFYGVGSYRATTAITAVQILFESGNITSGRATLYGMAKS